MSEGELQAAEKLTQAAQMISTQPAALQLRTLQTLVEVSAERNNTIIFPIPIELMPRAGEAASPAVTNLATTAVTALAASKTASAAQLGPAEDRPAELPRVRGPAELVGAGRKDK